jgi:hypothetical protein
MKILNAQNALSLVILFTRAAISMIIIRHTCFANAILATRETTAALL